MTDPYLIHFPKLGEAEIGYISVAQHEEVVPFDVKRIFWTYHTPESVIRGRHAHYTTEQVLIATAGCIIVTTEQADGVRKSFRLEEPNEGLYIPPHVWHTMQYSRSAVQLVLASSTYSELDYIRDYEKFKQVWGQKS
jgi:mannose-6-phosphate isomerase-like protein (cupin superfamily)